MAARMRGKRARLGALAAACAALLALAVTLALTQRGDAPGATAQTATTTPTTATATATTTATPATATTATTPATALPANPPTCTARTLGVSRASNPALAADCDTLLAIKSTLRVSGWIDYDTPLWWDHAFALNWSAGSTLRYWRGVTLGGTPERVTGLDFSDTRESTKVYDSRQRRFVESEPYTRQWTLRGVIPTQLANLTALQTLDFGGSELTGVIPTQLGSLTKLTRLDLSDNRLTGGIPTQLGNLTALTDLNLSSSSLTAIPTQLGGLTALTALDLSDNSLTAIPTWLGGLTALTALDLSDNSLSRVIPTQLGGLTALESLALAGNSLSGNLPAWTANLTKLTALDVRNNSLGGNLPAGLRDLPPTLATLYLAGNSFTGCIDERLRLAETNDLATLMTARSLSWCPVTEVPPAVALAAGTYLLDGGVIIDIPEDGPRVQSTWTEQTDDSSGGGGWAVCLSDLADLVQLCLGPDGKEVSRGPSYGDAAIAGSVAGSSGAGINAVFDRIAATARPAPSQATPPQPQAYTPKGTDTRSGNTILGQTIPVCSEKFDNSTRDAIVLWNNALKDARAVQHDVFSFQTKRNSSGDIISVPVNDCPSSPLVNANVLVVFESNAGSTCSGKTSWFACARTRGGQKVNYNGKKVDSIYGIQRIRIKEWDQNIDDALGGSEYQDLLKTMVHELGHILRMEHYFCPERKLDTGIRHAGVANNPIVTAMASGSSVATCTSTHGGDPRIEPIDVDNFALLYPYVLNTNGAMGSVFRNSKSIAHPQCTLEIDATTGGTANFALYKTDGRGNPVFTYGSGTGITATTGAGDLKGTATGWSGPCGTTLTNISIIENAGYAFARWTATPSWAGACSNTHIMDICRPIVGALGGSATDYTMTANFAPRCTLTLNATTGGTVKVGKTEAGVARDTWTGACGTQLNAASGANTSPKAEEAKDLSGYRFTGWTSSPANWASGCGASETCQPTVGSATGTARNFMLTANYAPQCTLTVNAGTGGKVKVGSTTTLADTDSWTGDCGTKLSGTSGANAAPVATADTNRQFTGWSSSTTGWTGGCTRKGACEPTVGTTGGSPGTYTLMASFSQYCTVTAAVSGETGEGGGSVSTTPADGRVLCGVGEVTYTATANSGQCFHSWKELAGASGAAAPNCPTTDRQKIIPLEDVTRTAQFVQAATIPLPPPTPQCTLTVRAGTGGKATIGATATSWTGDCGTQLSGTTAPKATANSGYRFTRWTATPSGWTSGCGTSATCTPTVGSATDATRSFTLRASFARRVVPPPTGGTSRIWSETVTTYGWTASCNSGTKNGSGSGLATEALAESGASNWISTTCPVGGGSSSTNSTTTYGWTASCRIGTARGNGSGLATEALATSAAAAWVATCPVGGGTSSTNRTITYGWTASCRIGTSSGNGSGLATRARAASEASSWISTTCQAGGGTSGTSATTQWYADITCADGSMLVAGPRATAAAVRAAARFVGDALCPQASTSGDAPEPTAEASDDEVAGESGHFGISVRAVTTWNWTASCRSGGRSNNGSGLASRTAAANAASAWITANCPQGGGTSGTNRTTTYGWTASCRSGGGTSSGSGLDTRALAADAASDWVATCPVGGGMSTPTSATTYGWTASCNDGGSSSGSEFTTEAAAESAGDAWVATCPVGGGVSSTFSNTVTIWKWSASCNSGSKRSSGSGLTSQSVTSAAQAWITANCGG